jgi:hypothetical protein
VTGQIYLTARGGDPTTANGCAPAALNENDIYVLKFDKDSDEHARWKFRMPPDYDGGTITASPEWTCATGDGGAGETVCWSISGLCIGDHEDYGGAMGTPQTSTDTWDTDTYCHFGPTTNAITLAGTPAASEAIIIDCMRDVSEDTLGGDAELVGISITFTRS